MKKILTSVLIVLLLISCSEKKTEEAASYAVEAAPSEEAYAAVEESYDSEKTPTSTADAVLTPVEQKIIKTGHFAFETASVTKTYELIKKSVAQNKGYIQSDETVKYDERLTRSLIIRIPNSGFQPVVDTLFKNVEVFDEQKVDLQDVTEEFVDVQSRLKAKKELENRYLQLLNKASSIKDMLEIEAQLSQIREEIEAQEGRLKYLQNRVSFSTINITFYEIKEGQKAPSNSYFNRLWNAVEGGFNGIGEFIIGIFTLWPLIVGGIIVYLFLRRKWKKKKEMLHNK
jgi:hypothetical protein